MFVPGGLLARDTETGVSIPPSCCCGLEDWREWVSVPRGGQPWLGHSPTPWIEHLDGAVRIWPDGGMGKGRPPADRAITPGPVHRRTMPPDVTRSDDANISARTSTNCRGNNVSDHTTYEGFLWTGSGSERVTLELGVDRALIVIKFRWMGQDAVPSRCELRFMHRPGDDWHGQLELLDAATAVDEESELVPVPELSPDDAPLPLVVEYLRVEATPVHVHPESQLVVMRPWGYADWNDHFHLLLLVDDLEGWPEGSHWEHIRTRLDKAKLARVEASVGG